MQPRQIHVGGASERWKTYQIAQEVELNKMVCVVCAGSSYLLRYQYRKIDGFWSRERVNRSSLLVCLKWKYHKGQRKCIKWAPQCSFSSWELCLARWGGSNNARAHLRYRYLLSSLHFFIKELSDHTTVFIIKKIRDWVVRFLWDQT